MRILRFLSALLVASVIAIGPLLARQTLSADDAKDHVGETATVCGSVVSTRYASSTKGQPTFLNLDKPYPNQVFTVLIWGENRSKFGTPESEYKGKRICVTGTIRGLPECATNRYGQPQADHGRVSLRHFQTNLNFKTLPRRIGFRVVQPSERTSLWEAANARPDGSLRILRDS